MPITTQQRISPIHSPFTTPGNKNAAFPQTTIQFTVKTSIILKNSQLDYQTFIPVTTSRQINKQKTSNRNNFSDQNYNFFAKSKTTKSPCMNSQKQSQTKNYNQNVPQQASHTVFFKDQPPAKLGRSENDPFFLDSALRSILW